MDRQIAHLYVTPEIILAMLTSETRWCAEGIPADAKVVGAGFDPARDAYWLVLASPSFAPVPLAQLSPALNVIIRSTDDAS